MSDHEIKYLAFDISDVLDWIAESRRDPIVNEFHVLWYRAQHTWWLNRYKELPLMKCSFDLQNYHEILWQVRPDLIIETGTMFGGSAVWFADQLDLIAKDGGPQDARVITIDVTDTLRLESKAAHDRITWIQGDSIDPAIVQRVADVARDRQTVLVSLDSSHEEGHVLRELEAYAALVTPRSYCVVEDTNLSGRPMVVEGFLGPGAAVDDFCAVHPEFVSQVLCERHLLGMNPGGWLQRVG